MSLHKITYSTERRPEIRSNPISFFDLNRNRFVIFGGFDNSNFVLGDTNEYNLASNDWAVRAPITPPAARAWTQASYDIDKGKAYVFGGSTDTTQLAETLEYDGSIPQWNTLSPASPPAARAGTGLVYDSVRKVHTLYGGIDEFLTAVLGDIWELDVTGTPFWTEIVPTTGGIYLPSLPAARGSHMMAHDVNRDLTVIVGGTDIASVPFVETLLWDGVGFRLQTTTLHPSGDQLSGAAIAYVAAIKKIVLFGGSSTVGGNRTWALDEDGWQEIFFDPDDALPVPRNNVGYGTDGNRLFVFGGADPSISYNDLWATDTETWEELRTGFLLDPLSISEILNGLRLAGSAPFPSTVVRVSNEKGVILEVATDFEAIQSIPVGTEIRYTIEIDGVEWQGVGGTLSWIVPTTPSISNSSSLIELRLVIAATPLPTAENGSVVRVIVYMRSLNSDITPELEEFRIIGKFPRRLCSVSGTIIDSNGPIQGAVVRVRLNPDRFIDNDYSVGAQDEAITDADGIWSLLLFETETVGTTVDFSINYTGPGGLISNLIPGLTIPNADAADFADLQ